MSLSLYLHPLASFCWKPLIALYESGVPFEPIVVDLGDDASRTAFEAVWPIGRFPVLRDDAANLTVPESSIIIEYLAGQYATASPLVPRDPDKARDVRFWDRFYDLYVNEPMQKIVTDRLRPEGKNDPHGVAAARALLTKAYGIIEKEMGQRTWAAGETFTMADCAASPALFYADKVMPLAGRCENGARYLVRLMERPSFARVLKEAQPYFAMFPQEKSERDEQPPG